MKVDRAKIITDQIIEMLETGTSPWERPWNSGASSLPLRSDGTPYQGSNVLSLWAAAAINGYASAYWMTYKGAQRLGAQVRKGEKAQGYAVKAGKGVKRDNNGDVEGSYTFFKFYAVFNADQIDGLPEHYYAQPEPINPDKRDERAEEFFSNLNADIRHGGNAAFYSPSDDHIQMPEFEHFKSMEAYYAVLSHESTHWTSHKDRTDRDIKKARFGNEVYAAEELVAELGSAFLCAELGLSKTPREDHASYIKSWIKVLNNDSKAIFTAASLAQKATDYMKGCQPVESVPAGQQGEQVA